MEHVGNGFMLFMKESGAGKEYMGFVQALANSSALERKTRALCYLSVLAAAGLTGGMDFHVREAKEAGATRQEVISAVVVGFPAVGLVVAEALEEAVRVYDQGGQG